MSPINVCFWAFVMLCCCIYVISLYDLQKLSLLITYICFLLAQAACQAAAAFCKEKGKNISKLAMQYSLSNKDISSILVGMNSVRQVMTYHCSYRCNFFFGWIILYMNQTFQFH